jgi:hypothetical protein
MRSKTQERIEELARERAEASGEGGACRAEASGEGGACPAEAFGEGGACPAEASGEGGMAIDLALVEEGIEIGKRMMAEMIATYPTSSPGGFAPPASAEASARLASSAPAHETTHGNSDAGAAPQPPVDPAATGGGYLNEVRKL